MVRNIILKILLFPFSILYGIFSVLNSLVYKLNIIIPIKFTVPVISIGNLTVGGTGKTPHVEYLVNLLKPYIKLAILSRGYKRKTKGFREVLVSDNVKLSGDEPLLFKRKYNDISVFVSENKIEGISQILMKKPDMQTIILDDAFQHREISPASNILLTEYDFPFFEDFYLPAGRLREWRSGYKRADIIIVTKCPMDLTEEDKIKFIDKLSPLETQKVYFSYYRHFNPYYLYDSTKRIELKANTEVLLISALASTSYLLSYLYSKTDNVHSMEFTDHHQFSFDEMEYFKNVFDGLKNEEKVILTTEKDAMRLDLHRDFILKNKLPIYVLPVSVDFLFDQRQEFDESIKQLLLDFKV